MKKTLLLLSALAPVTLLAQGTSADSISTHQLDAVLVYSTRTPVPLKRVPGKIEVIRPEAIEAAGLRDLTDVLKNKSSVDVIQYPGFLSNVGIRGFIPDFSRSRYVAVLINGIPSGTSNLSTLTLGGIEQIEVLKGPFSSIYGTNAMGGVINVITKAQYKNSVRVAAGDRGQRDYAATIDLGKVGLAVSRSYYGKTGNLTDVLGDLKINGVETPYMVGFGKSRKDHVNLTYKINDAMRLSYIYSGKNHSIHYNDAAGQLLKYFNYDDDEHFANFSYQDQKGWSGSAYYNYRSISNPDYFTANPSVVEWEKSHHRHYGAEVKKVWKDDVSTTLVGLSAKRQTYVNENQKYRKYRESDSTLRPYAKFGGYGMNEYSLIASYDRDLSPVTAAILSTRADWVKSSAGDYSAFLPQLQVTTRLSRDSAVYASVGKFFRMPNFRNLYYASAVMVPNPNLSPESGWNYEAGYKYDNKGRRFTATVFHTSVSDQIVGIKGADGKSYQTNAASYRNTGVEISYAQDVDAHFSFNTGVTYGNPERKYKAGQDWVRALGRYQMTAGVNYENRDLTAAVSLSYWGDRGYNSTRSERTSFVPISGNLLVSNLHVACRFTPALMGTFDVDNLFNRRDYTNSGTYYTVGRSFLVGVNYVF